MHTMTISARNDKNHRMGISLFFPLLTPGSGAEAMVAVNLGKTALPGSQEE